MNGAGSPPTAGTPLLVVLSGPSGVGKDAIIGQMRAAGAPYFFAVSATARPIRDNEVDGVDYLFVRREKFISMIRDGELLEWAEIYGNLYGVPKMPVRRALEQGRDVILKIDPQGADNVRLQTRDALYVYIMPPSLDALACRLRQRNTESESALKTRMRAAAREMDEAGKYDHVVINETRRLDAAAARIMRIIASERTRADRRPVIL